MGREKGRTREKKKRKLQQTPDKRSRRAQPLCQHVCADEAQLGAFAILPVPSSNFECLLNTWLLRLWNDNGSQQGCVHAWGVICVYPSRIRASFASLRNVRSCGVDANTCICSGIRLIKGCWPVLSDKLSSRFSSPVATKWIGKRPPCVKHKNSAKKRRIKRTLTHQCSCCLWGVSSAACFIGVIFFVLRPQYVLSKSGNSSKHACTFASNPLHIIPLWTFAYWFIRYFVLEICVAIP